LRRAAAVLLALALPGPLLAAEPVRVRASVAFEACLDPALAAFTARTGVPASLDVAEPGDLAGIDLVVGDDSELTSLLEGGRLVGETDLGTLPWVRAGGEVDATAQGDLVVLGGAAGRRALQSVGRARMSVDAGELRSAPRRLVPRSLAGPGPHRQADVAPLIATAAVVRASARAPRAQALLAFLSGPQGQASLAGCLGAVSRSAAPSAQASYAVSVVDWWLPRCSLDRNLHNDPEEALGPPDAARLSADRYRGMFSTGQGGFVVVDAGVTVVDGPGADVRVYQTTSNEPVTLYASSSPQGPFVPIALREFCGVRSGGGIFSNHCEFDLGAARVAEARYLKVEDGELYPCMAGGTATEGSDIDSVQILNSR
jgi:hypothetical protein